MLIKDEVWVHSVGIGKELNPKTCGKWLIYGNLEELREYFKIIDKLVEEGEMSQAKLAHKENPNKDPLPRDPPVICVYADDETKEDVRKLLEKNGICPNMWKYDHETDEDWKPGGKLYERSMKQRDIFKI